MNRVLIVFLLVLMFPLVSAVTNVTCGDTISSAGNYQLNESVDDYVGTWITITADDVVLMGMIVD